MAKHIYQNLKIITFNNIVFLVCVYFKSVLCNYRLHFILRCPCYSVIIHLSTE